MNSVRFILLILITIGISIPVTATTYGNAIPSYSTLSVPTSVETGSSVAVEVNVSDSNGGSIGFGDVNLHYISINGTIGNSEYTGQSSLLDIPRFTFSVTSNRSVDALRIPLLSITNTTVETTWKLYRSFLGKNTELYAQGDLFRYDIESQIAGSQSLFILPSSYQGGGYTNPSRLDLSPVYIYDLVLDEGLSNKMYFEFPYSNTGVVEMTDDTSTFKKFLGIDLLLENVTTNSVSSNGISTSWTPTISGTTWILSSYNAPYIYGPSSAVAQIQVNDPSINSLTANDTTTGKGSDFTLSAILTDQSGSPLEGLSVDFKILIQGTYWILGSNTTDALGVAHLTVTKSLEIGEHTFMVESLVSSSRISDLGKLTVIQPALSLQAGSASQTYGDTRARINGLVINSGSMKPVDSAVVEIWRKGARVNATFTDSSGMFSLTQLVNENPGIYTDYFLIKLIKVNYTSSESNLNLTVEKITPSLTFRVNGKGVEFVKYTDQPVIFSGTGSGEFTNVELQKMLGNWSTIMTFNFTDTFIFNYSESVRGNYQYRLYFGGNSTHNEIATQSTYLYISEGDGIITREGLNSLSNEMGTSSDPIRIEYDKGKDIGVFVFDANGIPIQGATVVYYLPVNYTSSLITTQINRTSDSNGWVSLAYFPSRSLYDAANNGLANILVEGYHNDYIIAAQILYWKVTGTQIHLNATLPSPKYSETARISFEVVTDSGRSVEAGTSLDLTIEGSNYTILTDASGIAYIDYNFMKTGLVTFTVDHSSAENYPYNNTSKSFTIEVQKGNLTIISFDSIASAGDTNTFTAYVEDSFGNVVTRLASLYYGSNLLGSDMSTGGVAQVDYHVILTLGNYSLMWKIDEDANYLEATVNFTLTVNKINTYLDFNFKNTVAYGSRQFMNISLVDPWNAALLNQHVIVTIGSNIWDVVITSGITQLEFTPSYESGSQTVIVSYAGAGNYNSVQGEKTIYYETNTLQLQFIIPINTTSYYAEDLFFSFRMIDSEGDFYINKEVNITIDTVPYSYLTDSVGIIRFNETLKLSSGVHSISISLSDSGYTFPGYTQDILHQKRFLDVGSNQLANSSLSAGQPLSVWIQLTNGGVGVGGAEVNVTIGSLSRMYTTNSSGYVDFTITYEEIVSTLGTLHSGDTFTLQVFYSHSEYEIPNSAFSYIVLAKDLKLSSETPAVTYNTSSQVLISIEDNQSVPASNLYLKIEDGYGFSVLLLTDINGQAQFTYTASSMNLVKFSVTVLNADVNLDLNQFDVFVEKAAPILSYELLENESHALIGISVETGGIPFTTEVQLEGWNGSTWTIIGAGQSDGGRIVFHLDSFFDQYRAMILEDTFTKSAELLFTGQFQTPSLSVADGTVQLGENATLAVISDIPISGTLLIYTSVNGSNIYLGTLEPNVVGTIFTSLLDEGNYTIRVQYDGVAWTNSSSTTFLLEVDQQILSIETNLDGLSNRQTNSVDVRITDSASVVQNVKVYIEYFDGMWISLDSQTTNVNGKATFVFYLNVANKEILIRIRADPISSLVGNSVSFSIHLIEDTYFRNISVRDGTYTDGGNISAILSDSDGNPLSNQMIFITVDSPGGTKILSSSISGEDGSVFLTLPVDLSPNNYSIYLLYNGSLNYASSRVLVDYKVSPEIVEIGIISDIQSYSNRTLLIELRDNDGNLQNGTVKWIVFDQNHLVTSEGSIIVLGRGTLVLDPIYGEYTLTLKLSKSINFQALNSKTVELGWSQVSDIELGTSEFVYPVSKITITVNVTDASGNPVNHAIVKYYVNGTAITGSGFTDEFGQWTITINGTDVNAGEYLLHVFASNTENSEDIESTAYIVVEEGYIHPTIAINDTEYLTAINPVLDGILPESNVSVEIFQNGVAVYIGSLAKVPYSLDAGQYTFTVSIETPNYHRVNLSGQFTVNPKPVNVQVSYEIVGDTVQITVRPEIPVEGRYEVTLTQGSTVFRMTTENTTFSIPIGSGGILRISINGNYKGEFSTKIAFPESTALHSSSSPITEIIFIGFLGTLAIAEQKFKILKRILTNIRLH